jgi:hypothetical protein
MRKWFLAALLAGALHGAVIRGTVTENQSGHPLSRATVILEPVPGSPGLRQSVRTNRFGFFEFADEPPGIFLLRASRVGYVDSQYGQKRWNSAGAPLVLAESDRPFLTFRLLRYAAITGLVEDENEVGIPEVPVSAYLNTRPPQLVAQGTADERGIYRIYGLTPGTYTVRSLGKEVEGYGYRPTFAHEGDSIEQAHVVDVEIEQEARGMNIRPIPGQLFSLSVTANPLEPQDVPVTLTLASEMGRQIIKAASHRFTGLPPGDYDIFAEAPADTPPALQGAYQHLSLGRDSAVSLTFRKLGPVTFQVEGMSLQAVNDGSVQILARKKDMAGVHETQVLSGSRAYLSAGPWQFAIAPIDGYYVSGYIGPGNYRRDITHPEGWNDATIINGGSARFSMSGNVSNLHGFVKDAGEPVTGAPVFLEPMDLEPARRINNVYTALTDTHGFYRFSSLPPGRYRLMSSFEYQMPDSKIMENARAIELTITTRTDIGQDLDLYVIR